PRTRAEAPAVAAEPDAAQDQGETRIAADRGRLTPADPPPSPEPSRPWAPDVGTAAEPTLRAGQIASAGVAGGPAPAALEPAAELPLPTAAEARVPTAGRERYAARLPPPAAPRPGGVDAVGTAWAESPRRHEDGAVQARRIAASRRRQALWLVLAVIALVTLAAALLVLLLTRG
ncbi:MAG: hypothetical protein QM633_12875, partial [Propionicimonas sp.]